MNNETDLSFGDLVEQFLGASLPEEMAVAVPMERLPSDARRFILRALSLMKRAGYRVTDFTPPLIRWFSQTVPGSLPCAWGGRIPPLTLPGRHAKLDSYVASEKRFQQEKRRIFVDIGCGFPPSTAADTAEAFPNWRVYGVDVFFADYVVYDPEKNYACFDRNGKFLYFQGFASQNGRALYSDPQRAAKYFEKIFEDLCPLLPPSAGNKSHSAEKDGNKIIRDHIMDFKRENLTFVRSAMQRLDTPTADIVRCMNLLLYFPEETRKKMLLRAGERLAGDGILIAGTNGFGIQRRYAVYRKTDGCLYPSEFAFSADNLGPVSFMAWFAIHDNDPEATMLADLSAAIRADPVFWPKFAARLDILMEVLFSCPRDSAGFLQFPTEERSLALFLGLHARIWNRMEKDGYVEDAVGALRRAGYNAWKNPVGDIAIRPPEGSRLQLT